MKTSGWIWLLCLGTLFGGHSVSAQGGARLGFGFSAGKLPVAIGSIFEEEGGPPHGDYSFGGGLTLQQPLKGQKLLTIGLQAHYELWHFHYGEINGFTAYYHFASVRVPVTWQTRFRLASGRKNGKFLLGGVADFGNLLQPESQEIDNGFYTWTTQVGQGWNFGGEAFLGLGWIANRRNGGEVHFNLTYHLGILKNRYFKGDIRFLNGATVSQENVLRSRGFKLAVEFYPRLPVRRGGKGCPRF